MRYQRRFSTLLLLGLQLIPLQLLAQAGIEYAGRSLVSSAGENGIAPIAGCNVDGSFISCLARVHPFGLSAVLGVLLLWFALSSFSRRRM